jgi:hypothetical protein
MRYALALLIFTAACGGGSGGGPAGPVPVATVSLNLQASSLPAGQTLSLSATEKDANGNALTGRTVTWSSSATNVAGVTSAGLVTGVAAGVSTITATSEGKSAAATITVSATGPDCTGITPLNLAVGEVHTLSASERQMLCVPGGTSGGEYVLIPFNSTTDTLLVGTRIPFSASASGTSATTGTPPLAASALRAAGPSQVLPARRLDHSFELGLRQRERAYFGPYMRARGRGPRPLRSLTGAPGGIQGIRGLGATPAVGTTVTLNANGDDECTIATNRLSRVAAVSNNAIVVVDQTAPAGGFTDAEYLSFATTFDTLVFGMDTAAFGAPFDMDGNGRVILFFTSAVNALTPPGAGGFVGGFFFSRDLFPVVATPQVNFACATSNEGEMFYLPVVDPNGLFNGFFKVKATMQTDIIATLAHEFQHLINASRRIYVTVAAVDFEVVWLNEGMSHIAEELLYYRVSRYAPKQDIGYTVAVAPQSLSAINSYQVENLGRYEDYLASTDLNSPYQLNDSLATRGATWNLLRWALDQSPNPQSSYLKALVDNDKWGQPNFNQVFAGVGGVLGGTRQEVIANFFDNSGISIASQYAFPSWNFRDLLPHLGSPFPLIPKKLLPGAPQTYSLVGGGSGYLRFRVNAGGVAGITMASGSGALPPAVELILIRTQ